MCGPKFCSMNMTQHAEALDGRDQSQREEKFVELLAKAKAGRSGEPALDSTVDDLVF